MAELRRIYQAENLIDAQLVADALGDAGIDVQVHGTYLTGAIGELPVDATPSVWLVDESRADQAADIVCEYNASRRSVGGDWRCDACDETSGSEFQICWRCGKAR